MFAGILEKIAEILCAYRGIQCIRDAFHYNRKLALFLPNSLIVSHTRVQGEQL